jgi:DNA-binding MarR family transcriptional regulator
MSQKKLPLESWISYRFGLVATRMGKVMDERYVTPHDLPMAAWRSLAVIARFGPMSAGDLGSKTSSDPFRVVRAIDLLVQRGLITREPDPSDRRRARLEVTAEGRALYREIEKGAIANETFLRSALSDEDIASLERILGIIEGQVKALGEKTGKGAKASAKRR